MDIQQLAKEFDKCLIPNEVKFIYEKWKELKEARAFYEDDSYIS